MKKDTRIPAVPCEVCGESVAVTSNSIGQYVCQSCADAED